MNWMIHEDGLRHVPTSTWDEGPVKDRAPCGRSRHTLGQGSEELDQQTSSY